MQIHTIAIGADADQRVLMRIAAAAHSKYWQGEGARDLRRTYEDIATYW